MELLRTVISFIAGFIFVFQWYILMSKANTKFIFYNHNRIYLLCMKVSIVLSSIGALLSYLIYNKFDILILFVLATNLIILIVKTIFKENKINEFIEVKPGEYEILTDISILVTKQYNAKSVMKVNTNEESIFILFNIIPPELGKNIILDCTKIEEGYYLCNTYIYEEKKKFVDTLKNIFNYYVMIVLTYGCSIITREYLKEGIATNTDLVGVTMGYVIFNFVYQKTKYGRNAFTKFLHFIFGVGYVVTLIEIIFLFL